MESVWLGGASKQQQYQVEYPFMSTVKTIWKTQKDYKVARNSSWELFTIFIGIQKCLR